jgi:16S rRNA processing protein RimM
MEWASMVTIGRIVRPHGHRGQVVVVPESDFADERFTVGATVYLRRAEAVEAVTVAASRFYDGRWVLGLSGVESMDAAEALRDLELRIPEADLRVLDANAFYVHHLVGCDVRTTTGEPIGVVERVDLATGVPMLVVQGQGEVLVPFVDAICRRVDPDARVIEIDPPEGLIALNRTRM